MNGNDVLDSSLIYLSIISSSEFYHTILNCNEFLIIFCSKTLCARFVFVSSFVSRAFIAYFLYFLSLPPTHFNGILSFYPHTQTPIRSVSLRWSAEASEQRAAWVKRTQHHYMFNGMRLFVWPKKMEIRFICWIIPKLCVCGVSGGSKSEMFSA